MVILAEGSLPGKAEEFQEISIGHGPAAWYPKLSFLRYPILSDDIQNLPPEQLVGGWS